MSMNPDAPGDDDIIESGFVSPQARLESLSPEEKETLQRQVDLYNILNRVAMSADGHASEFKPIELINMLEARSDASEAVSGLLHNPAFGMMEALRVCIHMIEYELQIASTPSVQLLRSHLEVGVMLASAINEQRLKNPPQPASPIITVPSLEAAGLDDNGHA